MDIFSRPKNFTDTWLRRREIGQPSNLGSTDRLMLGLYSSVVPCSSWDHTDRHQNDIPGGIFNLEFSPDGSLLVAACEKRSILMFDPLSRQLVHTVDNAHQNCVNCVRFLDSRVFATCSDDCSIMLWDARNLKTRIRGLYGHSNWVKNIEFSQHNGLLVTSGFDGSIYTWDINSYCENHGSLYTRVFHTNGLMRMRLSPDASKMIICTTGGYLMVIHHLDLRTLAHDFANFKPNMYRLMQMSETTIPVAANFTHLFSQSRKTNRIEFISDFPTGDEAEVVSSLQVHPQGWCALSRNISNDESTEWTCVHDIQDVAEEQESAVAADKSADCDTTDDEPDQNYRLSRVLCASQPSASHARDVFARATRSRRRATTGSTTPRLDEPFMRRRRGRGQLMAPNPAQVNDWPSDVWEALVEMREARIIRDHRRLHGRVAAGIGIDLDAPSETRVRIVRLSSGLEADYREREEQDREEWRYEEVPPGMGPPREANNRPISDEDSDEEQGLARMAVSSTSRPSGLNEVEEARMLTDREILLEVGLQTVMQRTGMGASGSRLQLRDRPLNHRIHKNIVRLTHYIKEPNVGKGFIKELCFSADGRLICSPYKHGVRLLAFNAECSELSTCVPNNGPVMLSEIATHQCHSDIVLSTKFSPRHCLLVSGCLNGRIVWHQPVV